MHSTSPTVQQQFQRPPRRLAFLTLVVLTGIGFFAAMSVSQAQAPKGGKKGAKPAENAQTTAKTVPQVIGSIPGAGRKLDPTALSRIIDQEVAKRLSAEKLPASALANDAEFLRRVYLDLSGVIPPADKVAAFLDSKEPNKRAQLIETLLADPRYSQFMAETWASMMVPRESNNRRLQSEPLKQWLTESFKANKPWNQLVSDLMTASGPQDQNGAVTLFIGNPTPDKMTDTTAKLFLGVQLQCAQCHNHPFTGWKQTEYWAMAAFFMKVRLGANPNQAAKKGISPSIVEGDSVKGRKGQLPESAKLVPAKFLQGEEPKLDKSAPYRPVLAKWMTSAENPFFARALVNRMWYHFHGRGLVNPVDDMHEDNPATHPELLAALTEQFKASGFDVKYLVRAICNSQTYQRSSTPATGNQEDYKLLSHAAVRVMTPEQMFDSLTQALGNRGGDNAGPRGKKAPVGGKKGGGGGARDQFVSFFHIDEGANPLEYQVGIPQALRLMNSAQMNNNVATINQAIKAGNNTPAQVIEQLYLATLSRRPNATELARTIQYVGRQTDSRTGYADVLWALLNSSEFGLNH